MNTANNEKLVNAAELFAKSADSMRDHAADVLAIVPEFPKVTENEAADIKLGLSRRAQSVIATKFFLKDGDNYAPLSAADARKADSKKVHRITAAEAMALTAHEFGKLATTEPNRHAIIKGLRNAVSTNVSRRCADLVRIINELKGKTRAPSTPKALIDRTKLALAGIDKMHQTATKKGDPDAVPAETIRLAEAAYMLKIEAYYKSR
jgi:hypothetical protein